MAASVVLKICCDEKKARGTRDDGALLLLLHAHTRPASLRGRAGLVSARSVDDGWTVVS